MPDQELSQAEVLEAPTPPSLPTMSGRKLAVRLGFKSDSQVRSHKDKPDFEDWTRSHDPDQIGWRYDSQSKEYHPIKGTHYDQ